jgi:hypothetical protein
MSQEQVVETKEKESEITTLNVYRKDLPLISTVKDLLGFENSQDLLHVILAKAIEEVERQERVGQKCFLFRLFQYLGISLWDTSVLFVQSLVSAILYIALKENCLTIKRLTKILSLVVDMAR